MKYLLITPSGQQYAYYIEGCAKIFQQILGGQIHVVDLGGIKDT